MGWIKNIFRKKTVVEIVEYNPATERVIYVLPGASEFALQKFGLLISDKNKNRTPIISSREITRVFIIKKKTRGKKHGKN